MESDDVTINVTIAVRVIAPEGVMTHTDTEHTYGKLVGSGQNRSNGVRLGDIFQSNGSSEDLFYTTNFPSYDSNGRHADYDAASGLWIHDGGSGTITRNMKIRGDWFSIYDDWKESGEGGGFGYGRAVSDREVLINEGGDVYLFYTVTLRKTFIIAGSVTVTNTSDDVKVNTPALYTTGPDTNGKGIAANKMSIFVYKTPTPYNGTFKFRLEILDETVQLWFIPSTVETYPTGQTSSMSRTGIKRNSFGFDHFTVRDTDITNLEFTISGPLPTS
jgi:hypothetical protein